jgi:hypothetical protein
MSSIASIVDAFIAENELDVCIKPSLQGLVNKCFEGVFKHIYSVPIPDTGSKTKAQKVLKSEKIEDPTECQTREDLHHCTTASLSEFCKKNELKVGGNKTDVIDRVWRFLQGTGSEEDKSPRNKAKAAKKVVEKHVCSGCNAKGEKCAVAGTECFSGTDYWFCWRHIVEAGEFIAKLEDPNQPKPKDRAPKAPKAAKAEKTKDKKSKSKAKAKAELESESESESEPEPVKKSKSKAKAKPKVESESESEPEPEPVKKPKKSKSKAKAESEPESDASKSSKKKKKVPEPETESEAEGSDQDSEAERKEYYKKLAKEQFEKELAELEEEEVDE